MRVMSDTRQSGFSNVTVARWKQQVAQRRKELFSEYVRVKPRGPADSARRHQQENS